MRNFVPKKSVNFKHIILGLFVLACSPLSSVNTTPVSAAACGSEPTSTTGRASQSVTVPENATYTIWSRLKAPDANPVEYTVYVDSQCFTIGQTALTPDTLTWVDYENGSTIDKATVTLSAGTHTLVLTAGTQDLELDRVMLLSDSCTPTGVGDDCLNDTTQPNTSITAPTNGSTVSGTTTVTATATDNDVVDYVEFYEGSTLIDTDTSAPYSVNWDTTLAAEGDVTLTSRAYDISGNTRTSSGVTVTVDNIPSVNANITSFTATPNTIFNGDSSTLDWTSDAGVNCSIDQGVGSVATSGSQVVSPTSTRTYTLTCQGEYGGSNDTAMATVTVNQPPVDAVIDSFTATPASITDAPNQSSQLSWSVSAGINCTINQGVGTVAPTGTRTITPSATTIYTLSCNGEYGGTDDTAQATVTVTPAPDTDGDTIKDYVEVDAPNSGDANDDGTPDWQQANVASFVNQRTGAYNTLVGNGDCDVLGGVSSAAGRTDHVMGVTSFTLECASAGQEAAINIILDQGYDTSTWEVLKLNAGLTNETDISDQVTISSVSINGQSRTTLSYTLVDGGGLDEDGDANALIVDPIAVRTAASSVGAPNSGIGTQFDLSLVAAGVVAFIVGLATIWYGRRINLAVMNTHRR